MRVLAPLLALFALTGCHDVCGSPGPFWVQAECEEFGVMPPPDWCEVQLVLTLDGAARVSVDRSSESPVLIGTTATNVTDQPVTITLSNACPSGHAVFDGLPDGFDVYETCLVDPVCDDWDSAQYELQPGESMDLEAELYVGGSDCNDALPTGDYTLSFELALAPDAEQPQFCNADGGLSVQ